MRLNRFSYVVVAIGLACAHAITVEESPASQSSASRGPVTPQPMRVVGYFASWDVKSKGTRIADLPAKDLTHIYYAFAKIDSDGRVVLFDPCVDIGVCSPRPRTPAEISRARASEALNPHRSWRFRSAVGRIPDGSQTPHSAN
jgi:GH18 family chitinase